MDAILGKKFSVLDHGSIVVTNYMGNDKSVIDAARVSYGEGTKTVSSDRGLINYLMKHSHTSPFEMCEIVLQLEMPIFVARQWIRHRTASMNEYSARYSIVPDKFYIPAVESIAAQSTNNKQGRGQTLGAAEAARVADILADDARQCYEHYKYLLNEDTKGCPLDPERTGVARELARMGLTLNYYTKFHWKIDAHNLMHFLKLRAHPHAQEEIRAYADVICHILKEWLPSCYDAFVEYRLNAVTLSAKQLALLQHITANPVDMTAIRANNGGLSAREFKELVDLNLL
jgi:thymidylate synthase (FAD)